MKWVPGLKDKKDWNDWEFDWECGAAVYLRADDYRNAEEFHIHMRLALVTAAQRGNNAQLKADVQALCGEGLKGADLFKALKARYTQTNITDKIAVSKAFATLTRRKGETTKQALARLDYLLNVDCKRSAYNPDDERRLLTLLQLLEPSDQKLAVHQAAGPKGYKEVRAVVDEFVQVEELGLGKAEAAPQPPRHRPEFGALADGHRGRGKPRGGGEGKPRGGGKGQSNFPKRVALPREDQAKSSGSGKKADGGNCTCCGKNGHTPSTCFAKEDTCHNCGKKGHHARMCKSAPKQNAQAAIAAEWDF
jgi:hypothetical protein